MKIGILSMQRVVNYGSFLQAYAMKGIVEALGHDCYFIDIKQGKKIVSEDIFGGERKSKIVFVLERLDRYIFKRIKHKMFVKSRTTRFNNEFFPVLGMGQKHDFNSVYDTVIIGSDEVFNCTQKSPWGLAKTLLGGGLDSGNIITYAASCGHTTLEKLEKYNIREEVKNAMSNLRAISVRDANTKQFAEKMTDKVIYEHLDPTFIYDFGDLVPNSVPEKNYILVYAYDNRMSEKETIATIKNFAKEENKKIISVGFYQNWCDKNILCNPFELLAYFKYADYVVTDTFHGTVFSIKYNKQFATIVRDSNKQKLRHLLKKFDLKNQEVSDKNDLISILKQYPNYVDINCIIGGETISAIEFLKQNINK